MNLAALFILIVPILNSCLLSFGYNKLWLLVVTFCVLIVITALSVIVRTKKVFKEKSFHFYIIAAVIVSVFNLFVVVLGYGVDFFLKRQKFKTERLNLQQEIPDTIIKGKILIKIFPNNLPAANAKITFQDNDGVVDVVFTDTKGEFVYSLKKAASDKKIKMTVEHIDCLPYQTEVWFIPNGITEVEIYMNKNLSSTRR